MSRRFKVATAKAPQVVYAEDATLPTLSAAGFSARVNAYIVGRAGACADGETDLWYLSLVGAHGQEATLRALWANLVSNRPHRGYSSDAPRLGEVGRIALSHLRKDLLPSVLGWRIHWNWRMERVPPGRDTHAVLESDLLTCHDPGLLRDLPAMSAEELDAQKRRPCFLLLARRDDTVDPHVVPLRHLRFLAARIAPLTYYPPFAAYLWERAQAEGEIEPLRVWCYDPMTAGRDAEASAEHTEREHAISTPAESSSAQLPGPVLVGAYLCRPRPLELMSDLQRWVQRGSLALPLVTHDMPEPSSLESPASPAGNTPISAHREEESAGADASPAMRASTPGIAPERDVGEAATSSGPASPLMAVVREIVAAAGRTADFEVADEFLLKVVNAPWMDLVLEAHRLPGQRRQVTVTHYREQGGDLIPDPDLEMAWDSSPLSLTVQGPSGPVYTRVPDEPDPARARTIREIADFAAMWAVNLRAQGFIQAAALSAATPNHDVDRCGDIPGESN